MWRHLRDRVGLQLDMLPEMQQRGLRRQRRVRRGLHARIGLQMRSSLLGSLWRQRRLWRHVPNRIGLRDLRAQLRRCFLRWERWLRRKL